MRFRSLLLGLSLICITGACDEEESFSGALSDAMESVPQVCSDYCDEYLACGRSTGGPLEDEGAAAAKRDCELTCAYHMTNGCYYMKYMWDYGTGAQTYDVFDEISGETALELFDCLWGLGHHGCEYDEEDETYSYSVLATDVGSDEASCSALQACMDIPDLSPIISYYWDDSDDSAGACWANPTYENTDDYFISYTTNCSFYFPNL